MKKFVSGLVIAFAIFLGVVVAGPFYVINEGEQAVVVRFGRVVSYTQDAGLHIKAPFIDQVVRYPRRIMTWDGAAQSMPTREMQFIFVDVTARWRIVNPHLFYTALNTVDAAQLKLSEIIDSAVRTVVGYNALQEMVRNSNHIIDRGGSAADVLGLGDDIDVEIISAMIQQDAQHDPIVRGRRTLAEEMLYRASPIAINQYGIEIIDVVTRQVRYTDELTQSVYQRMIRERGQIAQFFRSTGEGQMASLLGRTEHESRQILSVAYREAEEIRGLADAEAARIFAQAHMRNQGFFNFWRAIESYRVTLPGFNAMLSTDMEYFRFMFSPTN
ncbi:MAG: protease modulator HflC [Treponema sp.]|nr:protease modulator HflC [Treponema sp.]